MSVKILQEKELRECVGIDQQSLDSIAESFGWLHDGRANVPPVAHLETENRRGEVDIKTAYVTGLDRFAIKIASAFPGNVAHGLPSGSGMMVVLSAHTGFCEAVLLDNGYLTDLRTGLAGAVAADHLALKEIGTVGIMGTGVQARFQLLCLALVRKLNRVIVWGRSNEHVQSYVDEMSSQHQIEIGIADSIEDLARNSNVIVTATPSREPLLRANWLQPGTHITALGADFPGKQELHTDVLSRADLLVCDRLDQCLRLGELQHWVDSNPPNVVELGAIVRGAAPGRKDEKQITVCDLTGVGVQDTAIANRACEMAQLKGQSL